MSFSFGSRTSFADVAPGVLGGIFEFNLLICRVPHLRQEIGCRGNCKDQIGLDATLHVRPAFCHCIKMINKVLTINQSSEAFFSPSRATSPFNSRKGSPTI
ncbi:hypothetical protein CEXT_719691 [Caerostris extrusa]|uniref:Uncharacterized protein n=1 Tax=Caerostris extrusa TaxID=172846 RepID=A0AAV4VZS5_CAEEX|nr:hypothetical protein CEXT_719691 [Caerostris extrusa]